MYRICKTIEIANAHLLSKNKRNCRFPHGHTRKIEVVLESPVLNENDMVCDFSDLKRIVNELADEWDHALCINSEDPACEGAVACFLGRVRVFEKRDPTTEVLVEEFYKRLAPRIPELGEEVRLRRVRIWETSSSWAEYEEEDR